MNNIDFADKAKNIQKNYNTAYVYGTFGDIITDELIDIKKKQYPSQFTDSYTKTLRNLVGKNYWGFDCVGLIKGILWGWSGSKTASHGGATYTSNNVPDLSANDMLSNCTSVSTDFSKITIGEALWLDGHIIYIGSGLAIESTMGLGTYGQKVAISNVAGSTVNSSYPKRTWTKHGKLPYITYSTNTTPPAPPTSDSFKIGDIVQFSGTKHYIGANSDTGYSCKPGPAKISNILIGAKHPYCVIHTDSTSNVYGWVDSSTISISSSSYRTYTVQSGDSLWAIASTMLGNGSRYPEIATLNNIKDNFIYPGQVLLIPNK